MLKNIYNAVYVFKTYLQLPNSISKPYKCYSLKKLMLNHSYFDDDNNIILDCTCSYTCRYKGTGRPKLKYNKNVIYSPP